MAAATEITVAGQIVVAAGDYDSVKAFCKPRALSADDGQRELRTIDGEMVTMNVGAIGLVRPARVKVDRAFGFSRALGGSE